MVRFTGPSHDTVYLPLKPILIRYKVWVTADSGYFLRWSFHTKGIGPIRYNTLKYPGLAPIQGIITNLLNRLPTRPS
jgi:hypothetical protein